MGNWAKLLFVTVGALTALSLGAYAQCPRSGIAAPELVGRDLSGQDLNLADYQGKWVYIDFWASWCAPCMRKLPSVVELHNEMKDRNDFAVVSVSLDDKRTKGDLDNVQSKYGISFPVVYDGGGFNSSIADNWCVSAIPSTFLIDPQGQIYAAEISPQEAQRVIEENSFSTAAAEPANPMRLKPAPVPAPQSGTVSTPAMTQAQHLSAPAQVTAAFSYRMQLLDHAPSFGAKGLHQVQLSIPASAIKDSVTTFKVNAEWVDGAGQSHNDEYRLAIHASPTEPLMPTDVSITGDLHFFIDQTAGAYMLEIAVPSQYISLRMNLGRYDAVAGTYLPGSMER